MNHLPWPQNEQYLPLQVPYVCENLPDFDGLDFQDYPIRRGWSTPGNKLQWIDNCTRITGQRLQNWLLFGLLHVFLGRHFKKQDFIAWSSSSSNWIIDSTRLPHVCSDVIGWIQKDARLSRVGSSARKELRQKWENAFFETKFQYEFLNGNSDIKEDDELRLVISPVPILLQSLQRFAGRIFWLDEEIPTIGEVDLVPAKLSIQRMLDEHWCKSQVGNLYQLYSPFLNHYVSALPRPRLINHDGVCSWDDCVANNVDEKTYKTQHVRDTCACRFIGTDAGQLAKLIRNNRIPIAQLRLVNGQPEIELVAADFGMRYVSISHVWAGGLGNFKANELPSCQLARLYKLLDDLTQFRPSEPQVPFFEFQLRRPDWLEPYFRDLQPLRRLVVRNAAWTKQTVNSIYRNCLSRSRSTITPPVYFWMDTLCIPVNPQHKDLRQKAIGNMALTYAAAERCLVLDPELQRIEMKELTALQLNAHMLCSTWLTRSWTFQEARLSRAWYAQFADGLYNPNSRANGFLHHGLYGNQIIYRSDAQRLESYMIDWYHKMPAVRQIEITANQKRRLLSDSAQTFITVWNQLCSRSTSKPEDVHGILANTLDLSAEEVLGLPLRDRMKAILKAQESLPASLIYNSDIKIKDATCHWVPLYPESSRLSELGGSLTQTADGFLLDQNHGNPVGFLVDPSLPREAKIRLEYAEDAEPLWITFNIESDERPIAWAATTDTLAVCYVVDSFQRSLWNISVSRRPTGARFALRSIDGKTLHLVYEYSFLYSLRRRLGREEDYLSVQAERTGEDAVFHIDCGMSGKDVIKAIQLTKYNTDLSSWPQLSYHRDTTSELTSHGIHFYTPFWICYGLLSWTPFYYLAIFTSSSRPLLLPTSIFITRFIIGILEILRLHDWVNEHAYTAWVKTFDQSGSLKKRIKRTEEGFLEMGRRTKVSLAICIGFLATSILVSGLAYLRWMALAVVVELLSRWGIKRMWGKTRIKGWIKGWLKGKGWW
ncbi:MAG: hypothetical protein LQ352_004463 [Teloschistes flavicans]|nr:MAG: hypothetical protein LQ352_004463 [Teloschistes flavicans]